MTGGNPKLRSHRGTLPAWCGPALIAAIFLGLTVATWRKWPDVLIDFGRELYVPWQLLEGKVLYLDIIYVSGPLSPYLNALWFKIFGISLTTLIFSNLLILLLITCLIYRITYKSQNRFTAVLSCIVFLFMFGFGHITRIGNYNYVCPYSHELTHGILLSLLLVIFFCSAIEKPRYWPVFLSGFCFGLIFLGKGEVFLAVTAVTATGFFLMALTGKVPPSKLWWFSLTFAFAAIIPAGLFFFYFISKMSVVAALRGIAAWASLLGANVSNDHFYQVCLGFDHPWQNFGLMALDFANIALLGAIVLIFSTSSRRPPALLRNILGLLLVFVLGVFRLKSPESTFFLFNRALPLLTAATLAFLVISSIRHWQDSAVLARLAPLTMWAALAFALLAKMILNAHVWHYGFVLAMPGAILLIIVAVGLIPDEFAKFQGQGQRWKLLMTAVIIIHVLLSWRYSIDNYDKKNFQVGRNGDAFCAYAPDIDPRGLAVTQLLNHLATAIPPRATVAILPEGVMINYLSRHASSVPFILVNPFETEIFGEKTILESFKHSPPQYIVLVHRDSREHGSDFFGLSSSYGKETLDWINSRYEPVWQVLAEPLKDGRFGIKMLKEKSPVESGE